MVSATALSYSSVVFRASLPHQQTQMFCPGAIRLRSCKTTACTSNLTITVHLVADTALLGALRHALYSATALCNLAYGVFPTTWLISVRRPANRQTTTHGALSNNNASFCGASPLSITRPRNPPNPSTHDFNTLLATRQTLSCLAGASPNSTSNALVTLRFVATVNLLFGVFPTAQPTFMVVSQHTLRRFADNCSCTPAAYFLPSMPMSPARLSPSGSVPRHNVSWP